MEKPTSRFLRSCKAKPKLLPIPNDEPERRCPTSPSPAAFPQLHQGERGYDDDGHGGQEEQEQVLNVKGILADVENNEKTIQEAQEESVVVLTPMNLKADEKEVPVNMEMDVDVDDDDDRLYIDLDGLSTEVSEVGEDDDSVDKSMNEMMGSDLQDAADLRKDISISASAPVDISSAKDIISTMNDNDSLKDLSLDSDSSKYISALGDNDCSKDMSTPEDNDSSNDPKISSICVVCKQKFRSKGCHYSPSFSLSKMKKIFCEVFVIMSKPEAVEHFVKNYRYPFCTECCILIGDLCRRKDQLRASLKNYMNAKSQIVLKIQYLTSTSYGVPEEGAEMQGKWPNSLANKNEVSSSPWQSPSGLSCGESGASDVVSLDMEIRSYNHLVDLHRRAAEEIICKIDLFPYDKSEIDLNPKLNTVESEAAAVDSGSETKKNGRVGFSRISTLKSKAVKLKLVGESMAKKSPPSRQVSSSDSENAGSDSTSASTLNSDNPPSLKEPLIVDPSKYNSKPITLNTPFENDVSSERSASPTSKVTEATESLTSKKSKKRLDPTSDSDSDDPPSFKEPLIVNPIKYNSKKTPINIPLEKYVSSEKCAFPTSKVTETTESLTTTKSKRHLNTESDSDSDDPPSFKEPLIVNPIKYNSKKTPINTPLEKDVSSKKCASPTSKGTETTESLTTTKSKRHLNTESDSDSDDPPSFKEPLIVNPIKYNSTKNPINTPLEKDVSPERSASLTSKVTEAKKTRKKKIRTIDSTQTSESEVSFKSDIRFNRGKASVTPSSESKSKKPCERVPESLKSKKSKRLLDSGSESSSDSDNPPPFQRFMVNSVSSKR